MLVADADDAYRDALRDELEFHGYVVLEARSAEDVIPRLRGLSRCAVVVDPEMPGMDAVLQTLTASPAHQMVSVLKKPATVQVVLSTVDAVFRGALASGPPSPAR